MFNFLYLNLKKGIKKITDYPQLIYTIIVALLITGAFVFMASRFVQIATSAQERLSNVRIGSLQDAFVSFAADKMAEPEYLNQKISEIVFNNETIISFQIFIPQLKINPKTNQNEISYQIIASNIPADINQTDPSLEFLFNLAAGDAKHSLTNEIINRDQRLFKTIRAITDSQGKVLGAVVTIQTLSLADMAIQNSIKRTEILLIFVIALVMFLFLRHSKIIDYMDLYKKLQSVDQLKDDFISMASHELRTPLSIIRGYAEFAKAAPELSLETKDYISKIDVSTKELDSLVADILDVSRIEQGRMSFDYEVINPKEIIKQIVESLILPAQSKGLMISFDDSKLSIDQKIKIDAGRFKQILINIIGNAVKYTLQGEVKVQLYVEKKNVCIRVSDTGIGMSEEERKKLFEKFYRIRNKETENIRGTGLGLWITAQMIKQMDGEVSIESIKGVGSHFIISFPLVN